MGDLADESGLDVIRIHDNQAKSVYVKMDGSNCIIESNQFSTYAVLYDSKESPSTEEPSTENPSTQTPSTENPSTQSPSTQTPATTQTNTSQTGGLSDGDGDGTNAGGGSTGGSSVGSLRSSGSAKTGDEAPVAVMGTLMLLALGGFFVLRRKVK